MPSPNVTKISTSKESESSEHSYGLQEYLRSDTTISERCSGLAKADEASGSAKSHQDKMKDYITDFDAIWKKNSKDGK
ncbi:hypothetical protein F4804DRAFT_334268 [Jackrogersella minutella]|nr:hypothetical protein F4804DRAFT_334268 [Jackrogersella minutella]